MNKEKAIEYIKRAKEQLSYDLLTIRLCEMARNNLEKALKELWFLLCLSFRLLHLAHFAFVNLIQLISFLLKTVRHFASRDYKN